MLPAVHVIAEQERLDAAQEGASGPRQGHRPRGRGPGQRPLLWLHGHFGPQRFSEPIPAAPVQRGLLHVGVLGLVAQGLLFPHLLTWRGPSRS